METRLANSTITVPSWKGFNQQWKHQLKAAVVINICIETQINSFCASKMIDACYQVITSESVPLLQILFPRSAKYNYVTVMDYISTAIIVDLLKGVGYCRHLLFC